MEQSGVIQSKLLTTLRHATGDVSIECTADKTVFVMTNKVKRASFSSAGAAIVGALSVSGVFNANTAGLRTIQPVTNVNDTTPTKVELTTAFGDPTLLGRGFIGTVDDNDGDTNGFIVWASDANFFFLKGTKAT